jgi:CheY-like chemotaxis protein
MGIQPFIDLLTRKSGSDPTVKLAAPRIADAVARGKRITQEILRFTRIAEPSRTAVNVADWLQAFEPELEQLAGPGVTVLVEADRSLTMLADAHQLRQVFANLVVNAHHAMPHGGRLEVRAVADTMRNDDDRPIDAVHFTICDTGVGMPQDTLRYIFEPLFTTKKMGGTGLGLAVASQVVQQHEGHIYAESALGEGTTFHIVIPASEPAAPITTPEPAPRPRRHALRPDLHVMMVEDDDSVGAGLAAILDYEGISVDWVRLGGEAVARIKTRFPDALIFDLGLPDVDGIELYEEIASRWPDLPVLFSTGHGDETLLRNRRVGNHVGYLQKPYESDVLLGALETLLG